VTGVLCGAGDLAAAERACTAALASCRDAGDQANLCGVLWHLTIVDLRTGRTGEAAAHLRELLQIATQTGVRPLVHAGLDCCGHLCGLATATEYALLLAAEPQPPAADIAAWHEPAVDGAAGLARLSPRERELVTLVARGRTDAQIAAQLYITVRTVSSHLDRIRDKTGCRRRADLTRLALSAGLV
jgi:DNA-binding CsgD family transcriptional regulator